MITKHYQYYIYEVYHHYFAIMTVLAPVRPHILDTSFLAPQGGSHLWTHMSPRKTMIHPHTLGSGSLGLHHTCRILALELGPSSHKTMPMLYYRFHSVASGPCLTVPYRWLPSSKRGSACIIMRRGPRDRARLLGVSFHRFCGGDLGRPAELCVVSRHGPTSGPSRISPAAALREVHRTRQRCS